VRAALRLCLPRLTRLLPTVVPMPASPPSRGATPGRSSALLGFRGGGARRAVAAAAAPLETVEMESVAGIMLSMCA
jgi:hypothetical protein